MTTPIEFKDIRVGDIIRATDTYESGDSTRWEGKVLSRDEYFIRTEEFAFWRDYSSHDFELVERPEPEWTKARVIRFQTAAVDEVTMYALRDGDHWILGWTNERTDSAHAGGRLRVRDLEDYIKDAEVEVLQ